MSKSKALASRHAQDTLMFAVWDLQLDLEKTYDVSITWALVRQIALRGRYVVRVEAQPRLWPLAERPWEAYSRLYPSSDLQSLEGALFSALNRLARQLDDRQRELRALAGF